MGFRWNWRRWIAGVCLTLTVWSLAIAPAAAKIDDDNYDGNIFALYAGNGSLVPPMVTLKQAMAVERPTLLVFYLDDSRDCKAFSTTVSEVQAYYGRVASIVPVNVDSLAASNSDDRTDPANYYRGGVPQSVIFDETGTVVLDEVGQVPFEKLDDAFREVFDLLPRSESVELKRRTVNEVNTELTE